MFNFKSLTPVITGKHLIGLAKNSKKKGRPNSQSFTASSIKINPTQPIISASPMIKKKDLSFSETVSPHKNSSLSKLGVHRPKMILDVGTKRRSRIAEYHRAFKEPDWIFTQPGKLEFKPKLN